MDTIVYLMDSNILSSRRQLYDRCYRLCPGERRNKIDRLRFDADKRLSVAVYILFAMGSCQLFGQRTAPGILTSAGGKPYTTVEGLCFNLSHSGDYSVCGFSHMPIGIDIECGLKGMTHEEIRRWSCREAYGKYTGKGITETADEAEFAEMISDGCYRYRDRYIFSKTVDGHVLSVCSLRRRVYTIEVRAGELCSYLDEAERYLSE